MQSAAAGRRVQRPICQIVCEHLQAELVRLLVSDEERFGVLESGGVAVRGGRWGGEGETKGFRVGHQLKPALGGLLHLASTTQPQHQTRGNLRPP